MARPYPFGRKKKRRTILNLETLEDRCVPSASELTLFDNGNLVVKAELVSTVQEAPVPLTFNGVAQGNYQAIEIFHLVQGTSSLSLDAVDTISNSMVQLAYQNADGTSSGFGTSIGGNAALQAAGAYPYVLTITQADVTVNNGDVVVSLNADIGTAGTETITHHYSTPTVGLTTMDIAIRFQPWTQGLAPGASSQLPLNVLPGLTVSSMFDNPTTYNADLLKYTDQNGVAQSFPFTAETPTDQNIFSQPVSLDPAFSLIKDSGSTWQPNGPSIAVHSLPADQQPFGYGPIALPMYVLLAPVDLQGYLAGSTDPNQDNLTLWPEVGNRVLRFTAGTGYGEGSELTVSATVTATPPGAGSAVTTAPVFTTTVANPPTIEWSTVPGAASYEVSLQDVTTGTQISGIANVSAPQLVLSSSLNTKDVYRIQVRGLDPSDNPGPWSDGVEFTFPLGPIIAHGPVIGDPLPQLTTGAPVIQLIGTTLSTTPTISWTAVNSAESYDIWIDDLSTGQEQVVRNKDVAGLSFTPSSPLAMGDTYQVWVRANLGIPGTLELPSGPGPWSDPVTFTVSTDLAPTPIAPVMTFIGNRALPTYTWSAVAGADHYDLWIDDVTANVSQSYRNQNIAGTSFMTAPISSTAGDSYRWWVRAVSAAGDVGAWSDETDYVYYPLAAPTNPLGPILGTLNTTPALSWDAVSGAGAYDVWVDDVTSGQEQVVRDRNVSGTTFTPPAPLTRDETYRFWVRAIDPNFGPGAWSVPADFAVASLAPTLQGPEAPVIGALPTFTWSAVTGADHYDLWVDDLTTGQSQVVRQSNVAGESTTPLALAGGQTYRWWVRAVDKSGVPGPWSDSADFTYYTIAAPVMVGPGGATLAGTPTFSWNAVTGATAYDLWVDDLTSGAAQVVRNQNVVGTSFTPTTPLAMDHAYRFWVRPLDANSNPGPWSTPLDFAVSSLLRPRELGVIQTGLITVPAFSFTAVTGADHYDLWIDDLTTGQPEVVRVQDIVGTQIAIMSGDNDTLGVQIAPGIALTGGDAYQVWVRAVNAQGQTGMWSDPFDFSIPPHALAGIGQGTYTGVPFNPDIGVGYTLQGDANLAGLGHVTVEGSIGGTGFIIIGHGGGTLTFTNDQGSVTVDLEGPAQGGFSPPPEIFHYQVISGTGAYQNLKDQGSLVLTLTAPTTVATGSPVQGGFTLTIAGGNSIVWAPESGVEGIALVGPVFPVERPGVPNTQPLAGAVISVETADGTAEVTRVVADSMGRFHIRLAPGRYLLDPLPPQPGAILPRGTPQTIDVLPGDYTDVTVNYDSGIA